MKKLPSLLALCLVFITPSFCSHTPPRLIAHPRSPEDHAQNFLWHAHQKFATGSATQFAEFVEKNVRYAENPALHASSEQEKGFRYFFHLPFNEKRMDSLMIHLQQWILSSYNPPKNLEKLIGKNAALYVLENSLHKRDELTERHEALASEKNLPSPLPKKKYEAQEWCALS
jgi:hypothetical protein